MENAKTKIDPKQIERMNDVGSLQLAEIIVSGIQEMAEQVLKNPTEDDILWFRETFQSDWYDGLTMGNGEKALKWFNNRL